MGGGIYNTGTMTLTKSTVTNNSAGFLATSYGGGIYNAGTMTLTDSTIASNNSTFCDLSSYGGGIYNTGTVTITDCTVTSNSAGSNGNSYGGGIYNTGTVTITNSTVTSNSAGSNGNSYGGGIYNTGTVTITNSTVTNNSAWSFFYPSYGGGLYSCGTMAIVNSTIANNSVNAGGGGVDNQGGVMSLVDCQISGNTAGSGGGIRNSGTLAVSSSYIIGNQVQAAGGGISVESGYLVLTDSQIQGNSAAGPAHASPNYAGPALGGGLYVGGGNVARLHQRLPGQQRRGCQRRARLVVAQSLIGGAGGAGYGGAICVEAGTLQLEHNTITWNEAVGGSGGDAIFPSYTGTLEGYLLSYCCSSGLMAYLVPGVWTPYGVDSPGDYAALAGNGGSGQGGGISILGGTVTAISNVFSDNQSIGGNGGDAQGGYLGYYEHSGYDMYTGEFFDETWPIYATISPGTSGSSSGADISGPIQFLQNNSFTTVGGSAVDTMTPLVINQFTVDQGEVSVRISNPCPSSSIRTPTCNR